MKRPTRETPSGRAYLDLQNQARRQNRPTQELLILYALERWLARLEASDYASHFVLKGGMLLAALNARRTTVDADLLGRRLPNDEEKIASVIADIARTKVEVDDGVLFDGSSIETQVMRESDQYAGIRISMAAGIASAKLTVRLDINFGDPVTPSPDTIVLPSLRPDLPSVTMLGYPIETVLAEKLCTAITLRAANTRIRDYTDVYTLITRHPLQFDQLKAAFDATATYRAARIRPFAEAVRGFTDLRSNSYRIYRTNLASQGEHLPLQLGEIVVLIESFVAPLIERDAPAPAEWDPATRQWLHSRS